MNITIKDEKDLLTIDFLNWLLEELKDLILSKLNPSKIKAFDNYLNKTDIFKLHALKKYSCLSFINFSLKHLILTKHNTTITIKFSNKIYLTGLTLTTVDTFCKFINYGDATIKGYPIFTECFTKIVDNLNTYVNAYYGA